MSKTLRFYGYCYDFFEMEGDLHDEIACYKGAAAYELKSADGHMVVSGAYGLIPGIGAWVVGIAPFADGVPLPQWPMHYEDSDSEYSHTLVVVAPDDVRVTRSTS